MKFSELKKVHESGREGAPASGQLLIYTRQEVLFRSYASLDEVEQLCGVNDILEIHLFDQDKEYRALASTGSKAGANDGVIEYTADFSCEEGNVFIEEQLLEMEPDPGIPAGTLRVMNHISYDENGMASVDDYRMAMGGLK